MAAGFYFDIDKWTNMGNRFTFHLPEERQSKAKEYLFTLDLSGLLQEETRTLEASARDSLLTFPNTQNKRINYTIWTSEYLDLVHQRIREVVLS